MPVLSLSRPHSRAFHFAWLNFMMCFIMWFAIPPVMPTLKKAKCAAPDSDICLKCAERFPEDADKMKFAGQKKNDPLGPAGAKDKECKVCYPYDGRNGAGCGGIGLYVSKVKGSNYNEVQNSTMIAISGTIILRVLIGPISDGIGIRMAYTILLLFSSICGFLAVTTQNYQALCIWRFMISFAGASFVLTQLWTTTMFDLSVVGIANATSAGWGNLGGGIAQVVNTQIFKACKAGGMNNDAAWRSTIAWSPAVIFLLGVGVYLFSDDCPYGNYSELKKRKKQNADDAAAADAEALKQGGEPGTVAMRSLIEAGCDWQVWVLHLAYMFSFGVELIVNGNIVSYFTTNFGMTQEDAGTIGSVFGLLNFCMRSLGGYWSDLFNARYGVRGRLWALFLQTFAMGLCLISFSTLTPGNVSRGGLLINLIMWGSFTNMTEGGCFAVVPYVLPPAVGGVAGIVGAGGNMGALLGNALMIVLKAQGGKSRRMLAFCTLGWGALASAFLMPLLWIRGVGSMFRAQDITVDAPPAQKTEAVAPPAGGPMPSFAPASFA